MALREFYPPIDPFQSGTLSVDEIHTLYWEQSGNPAGIPVIYLHGGPGAGCSPTNRQYFDPQTWRVILFDQRGCGRSTPLGETRNNTTEHLIEDIEKLRKHLNIEKWHVFGGSWGSTLAIAYGEAHPERCLSFILRGIFLLRQSEIEWYANGLQKIRPEAWKRYASLIPVEERDDIIGAYLRRLKDPDPTVRSEAARRMIAYELGCATIQPEPNKMLTAEEEEKFAVMPLMEAHYMTHNRPIPDSKYLDNVGRIKHLPAVIVHGRYDLICPIITAFELHEKWPKSELVVVEDAGHSAFEPGIRSALIEATDKMRLFRPNHDDA